MASEFVTLIEQVRAGDEASIRQLVQEYEPFIRRSARNRLRHSQLRRALDSVDVCQSVLASLLRRSADGQFEIQEPAQLQRLLNRMVRNKIVDAWRRHRNWLLAEVGGSAELVAHRDSTEAVDNEIFEYAARHFSPEERQILDLRRAGESWNEIASRTGVSPDAARKKLTRAFDRLMELGGLDA